MAFTFKDYQENERIKELRNKLNNVENAKPDYSESNRRISTGEEFGCIVCVKSDGFNENDYEEYEIPTEEETEEETL